MTLPLLLRRIACALIGHDVRVNTAVFRGIDPTIFRCKRCHLWFEDMQGTWAWKEPK